MKPKGFNYTQQEIECLLQELFDKNRIHLMCDKHGYVAGQTPPAVNGCRNCWLCWYWYQYASTPPHLREERLDQIESAVNHAVELDKKGLFDFKPDIHPIIKIEKDKVN